MAAGEIRAGKAYVELSLKDQFTKGLDKAAAKFKSFGDNLVGIGTKLAAVGGAGVVAMIPLINAASDLQETVSKFDTVFGTSADAMRSWADAFGKSVGRSKKDVMDFAAQAQTSLVNQLGDPKLAAEMSKALTELAIDLGSFNNVSDADAFAALMSAFRGEADPIEKFGVNVKESAVAAELLKKGLKSTDATEAQKAMARYSIILAQTKTAQGDAIRTGDGYANSMKRLKAEVFDASAALGSALLPAATKIVSVVTDVIVKIGAWANANKGLVVVAASIVGGILAAGAALLTLGFAFKAVGIAVSGLSAAFGVVTSIMGAMLNPIVLIGAGLAALVGYFAFTSEAGGQVLQWLSDKWNALAATVSTVIGGIADALAAGDIGLAAQILWVGIKAAFTSGTQELQNKWSEFKAGFVKVAGAAFYGALEIWANVKAGLLTAFESTVALLGNVWDAFTSNFADAWDTVINETAKGINWLRSKFDDSFDNDAASKAADDDLAQRKKERDEADRERLKNREAEKDKNIKGIESERDKTVNDINKDELALSAGADAQAKEEMDELAAKKTALQDQLKVLRDQAKLKADGKKGDDLKTPVLDKKKLDIDKLLAAKGSVEKVDVKAAGTFSAAALRTLGTSPVLDRVAKAAEDTAKNTKKLLDEGGFK